MANVTERHSHDSVALYGMGGFPGGAVVINLPANAGEGDTEAQENGGEFNPWVRKIHWNRK